MIQSVSPSVHPSVSFVYFLQYFREEWVDFIHIWYSNKVPCFANACKISLGSVTESHFPYRRVAVQVEEGCYFNGLDQPAYHYETYSMWIKPDNRMRQG